MGDIRKTIYRIRDQNISLAYVPDIPGHPETGSEHPVPESPPPPMYYPGERKAPAMTERRIRRALGKDPAFSEKLTDRIGYAATMHRIDGGGV